MKEEEAREPEHWRLDKRVPIAFLAFIVIQTVVFAFFMGGLTNRVEQIEGSRFTAVDGARVESMAMNNRENLDRLEDRTLRGLDDIKADLDAIRRHFEEGVFWRGSGSGKRVDP